MEMIKECITIDSLKKKIYQQNKNSKLIDFFKDYYGKNIEKARYNFCSSLAGYSLICYFLQIKDRHNGNILLHKDGYIIHIDFGFFLSNMPGLTKKNFWNTNCKIITVISFQVKD